MQLPPHEQATGWLQIYPPENRAIETYQYGKCSNGNKTKTVAWIIVNVMLSKETDRCTALGGLCPGLNSKDFGGIPPIGKYVIWSDNFIERIEVSSVRAQL